MPAQKRTASPATSPSPPAGVNGHSPPPPPPSAPPPAGADMMTAAAVMLTVANMPLVQYDSDGEGSTSQGSPNAADVEEFILVKLADIRKEVQCPICLGIIRKTRTVMECLHRFCRECIDKSMRLGNNECPACRTHCASRRSLRDDPNYDSLIAALYPDIDEYEEEELAFHEEEKTRNRQIQESIAETFKRQTEALGKKRSSAKATAAAFVRKSQRNNRSSLRAGGRSGGRDAVLIGSDDDNADEEDEEEHDANGNEGGKDSSAEERSPESRNKRLKRMSMPQTLPATAGSSVMDSEEIEDMETRRENLRTSSLKASQLENLAWGKAAARSQNRQGSGGIKSSKGGRLSRLAEHLRNSVANDEEIDVFLTLQPMDEKSVPSLEEPHISCLPSVSIAHLCQLIAKSISTQAEKVEMFVRKPQCGTQSNIITNTLAKAQTDPSEELQILGVQESLAGLHASLTSGQRDLVLLYCLKM